MERGGGMDDGFERWIGFNGFVEGGGLGDIFDDDEVEFGLRNVGVVFEDVFTLLLRSDGCDDGVAVL